MSLSYETLDVELRTARTVAPPWQLFASQPDNIASSQAPWRLTVRNKNTCQHCVAIHLILLTQFNPNYALSWPEMFSQKEKLVRKYLDCLNLHKV